MTPNEEFPFHSRRSPVFGREGMVATSQPLAVSAGVQMLAAGGNAADAAVAAAAALSVTEPTSTGLGGDCFALYYEAKSRKVTALNGSGRAPEALTLDRLAREGLGDTLPPYHPYTITVPGACAGWCDLQTRYGRLKLKEVLGPAIRLAEGGFPVAPITAYFWAHGAARQLRGAPNGRELTIDGRGPRAGEIFRNPGMARTLKAIVAGGQDAFYRGEIGRSIATVVRQAGGCLTEADLDAHASTWVDPIHTTYRGLRLWECPPNGQGLAALLALNILEHFDLGSLPPLSTDRLHTQIEAMRLAFADARWFVTDPEVGSIPLKGLLDKAYAAQRARLIDSSRAQSRPSRGSPEDSSDTVYLSVVDGEGSACSFINSNYMGFGTGIVPEGWGFSLQNRGHNFSLDREHPNVLSPGKRPYHTIIPALATHAEGDELFACFGVMGGFMQPQGHMQVVIGLVEDGLDPQEALDRPRFCLLGGEARGQVALETGIPRETVESLVGKGHEAVSVGGYDRAIFGRGQIILRERESGVLIGGSDPRADGCAMPLLK